MKISVGFVVAFFAAVSSVQASALPEPEPHHDDWRGKASVRTKTVVSTKYVQLKPKTVTQSRCTKTTTKPPFTRIVTVSSCPRHPHHGGKNDKTITKTSTLSIPGPGKVTTVSVPTTTTVVKSSTITIPGAGEITTVSVPTTVVSTLVPEATTVVSTVVEPTTVISTLVEPTTVVEVTTTTITEPTTVVEATTTTITEPTTVVEATTTTITEPTTVVEATTTTITEPTTVVEATTTTITEPTTVVEATTTTVTATATRPVCTLAPAFPNGGFETGDWNTDGWTLNNASGGINWSKPGVVTNEQARTGSQSLKMAATVTNGGFSLGFKKVVAVCPQTEYRFTAYAKALTGSTRGNCQAYVSIDNVPLLISATWPNAWVGGAGFFNSGGRSSIGFRIDVYCTLASGPNEAIYWDDISLEAL
ncbi:hypothetical protein BJ508DRAFT_357654 [Ascobolus immersus RN42]|uniref:CBM-cenC domain-containing protein n=1 Tax=Ascobolus immersus RN42 TaxID=1160509 RepID=A0A3N4IZY7_ASCIM|nr:hypothetical protein BJ508DRAFT_357654 [Ascobolus immersus RN42]